MVGTAYADDVEAAINNAIGGNNSFGSARWTDGDIDYSVLSFSAKSSITDALGDIDNTVHHTLGTGSAPKAMSDKITIYIGETVSNGLQHLATMGLSRIVVEAPE
jgi:hypothetical protein